MDVVKILLSCVVKNDWRLGIPGIKRGTHNYMYVSRKDGQQVLLDYILID